MLGGARLQPAAQAQQAADSENPERIDAGGKANQRSDGSNYGGVDIMIRAAGQNESARRNQSERYRNKTGLDGDAPARLLETIPCPRDEKTPQYTSGPHIAVVATAAPARPAT